MSYQYSLAHLTVLGCPPPEMIYIAALCGYDYASIRPLLLGLPNEPNYELATNKKMMRATKQALADTGLKIHDIELFRIVDGKDVADYEPALEVGAELGAKSILSSIWTDDKPFYLEQFSKLAELAQQYGLNVDLEFVTWASVWDLAGAKEVLAAQTTGNVGLMVDTLHFHRSCVSPEDLETVPQSWFHFTHICDGPDPIPARTDTQALIHTGRDARLYVGEGDIDFAAILNRIPCQICSIELPHLERVKEYGYTEHARRCLATAKEHFAAQNIAGKTS